MTLYQLEVFAKVARLESFTKAARELRVGQPSVSALMIQLQKELGVKLFEKLGTASRLTAAGKNFLRKAQAALALTQEIKDEAAQVKTLKKGRLVVGGSGFAVTTLLPGALQAFKKAYPSIDVTLVVQSGNVLEDKLLAGEIDVAFLTDRPKSPSLAAAPYHEDTIVAVAAPDHPLARRRRVSLRVLAREPIIADGRKSYTREMVEALFHRNGLHFTPAIEMSVLSATRDAIKRAVANGMGIAFLSRHNVELDVEAGRLRVLQIPKLQLRRVMYLAFHKARRNPSASLFAQFVRDDRKPAKTRAGKTRP